MKIDPGQQERLKSSDEIVLQLFELYHRTDNKVNVFCDVIVAQVIFSAF